MSIDPVKIGYTSGAEEEAVRPSIYCADCGRAHPGPECTDPPR